MKRKRPPRPEPLTGSQAFGFHPDGRPTGAAAVGQPDGEHPLRGALLFGLRTPLVDGRPTTYICRDFACQAPVVGVDALVESLDRP